MTPGAVVVAVAAVADVSRAWLYHHADVRDLIIRLRTTTFPTESLHQLLDTARHEVAQLRADNLDLCDQLSRSLGHNRTKP